MPLNKTQLEAALLAVLEQQATNGGNPEQSRKAIAKGFSDAIDAFIKTGTVNTQVTGTATAGVVAGTGTGAIS